MSNLLLIPLEDSVVFPNMSVTLTVDVGEAERVFLVPVHEGEYASVGTVAEVSGTMRLPAAEAPSPFPACTAASRAQPTPAPTAASASR